MSYAIWFFISGRAPDDPAHAKALSARALVGVVISATSPVWMQISGGAGGRRQGDDQAFRMRA
jgi:hypothetical protein